MAELAVAALREAIAKRDHDKCCPAPRPERLLVAECRLDVQVRLEGFLVMALTRCPLREHAVLLYQLSRHEFLIYPTRSISKLASHNLPHFMPLTFHRCGPFLSAVVYG
jgi:hypothetical protein